MIEQYKLTLKTEDGISLPAAWAYRLYAWLLTQLPEEAAAALHESGRRSVAQYLERDVWTVSLFGAAAELLGPVLTAAEGISLHGAVLSVAHRESRRVCAAGELLQQGRLPHGRRTELLFAVPAAFKQTGRYTIFPREELLLQSLLSAWNELFPDYPLEDADMEAELLRGIHIVDYSLRSTRYPLKEAQIPGFHGRIFIEARLPVVLQELWRSLLLLGEYSGVGIKTTLGMGGIRILPERYARSSTAGSAPAKAP